MDWESSLSTTFTLTEVDSVTWIDTPSYPIVSGTINRGADTDLRESAKVTLTDQLDNGEAWVRIYMEARQEGDSTKLPLFTGLAVSPNRKLEGQTRTTWEVECYSVLKPADDVLLDRGYYIPAGTPGGEAIKSLLSVSPAPCEVEDGSPALKENIVAENNETRLTMALNVLKSIGWKLWLEGDGTIRVSPQPAEPAATLGIDGLDIIETSLTDKNDWFSVPNVFRAISNSASAVARDTSDGPYSIESRGREIWKQDTSVKPSGGESLQQYAERRLKEEQQVSRALSYTRRFLPDVYPCSVLRLDYAIAGITGLWRVDSQTITLGNGAHTKEEAVQIE